MKAERLPYQPAVVQTPWLRPAGAPSPAWPAPHCWVKSDASAGSDIFMCCHQHNQGAFIDTMDGQGHLLPIKNGPTDDRDQIGIGEDGCLQPMEPSTQLHWALSNLILKDMRYLPCSRQNYPEDDLLLVSYINESGFNPARRCFLASLMHAPSNMIE